MLSSFHALSDSQAAEEGLGFLLLKPIAPVNKKENSPVVNSFLRLEVVLMVVVMVNLMNLVKVVMLFLLACVSCVVDTVWFLSY